MIELSYKFKIVDMHDGTWQGHDAVYIGYVVRWYYGNLPWEYEDKTYLYYIVTEESKKKDEINPFAYLRARDIPNDLVYNLIYLDIEHEHLEDGVEIVTQRKKRRSLYRWSDRIIKQVDYDEFTGLTKERERAIIELEKEWFGEGK